MDFPGRRRATSPCDGSRDLDEKSSDLAKDVPNSSFRAHPVSRHCVREARNHADLCRTIWVLLGSAVCGPMHVQAGDCTDRWISARSSHRPTKLRLETFVGAQSVLPRRARGARNHADLYRTIWVLSGSAVCGPMGSVRTPARDREISREELISAKSKDREISTRRADLCEIWQSPNKT